MNDDDEDNSSSSAVLDQHAVTLAKLTANAVITLRRQAESLRQDPGTGVMLGQTYTGFGKWTTLAMLGVHNNLRKAGCIEPAGLGNRLTPLGAALAAAIDTDLQQALCMCRPAKDIKL